MNCSSEIKHNKKIRQKKKKQARTKATKDKNKKMENNLNKV